MEQPKRRGLKTTRSEREQKFPYIPDELLEANILPHLPVETLLRFRCVSKKWLHLISHTKLQKKEKLMINTMVERNHNEKNTYVFTSVDTRKNSQKVGEYDPWTGDHSLEIMGSCNGLLLIREYDDLFLWNPTIRYCIKILSYHRLTEDGYYVVGGLCFDSHNNDYKVVLMLSHQTPSYGGKFATVGSSKTKDWKIIDFPYRVTSVVNGPVFNNYLHCFASPENSNDDEFTPPNSFMSPHCIIYYDPETNEFARFPMPEPIESEGDILLGLGVLDGCFCMIRAEELGSSECTSQVLVMKEYGVKESWTVMFRIKRVSGWGRLEPLFYTREKGEILMNVSGDVVAYDITKKLSTYIETLGYEKIFITTVVWYHHTL